MSKKEDQVQGEYSLPKAIYYQCIWIIKDMERLRRWSEVLEQMDEVEPGERVFYLDEKGNLRPEEVALEACYRLSCIEESLAEVPEEYRQGVLDNVIYAKDFGDEAHPNTWKRWKQRFIYNLAEKLFLY